MTAPDPQEPATPCPDWCKMHIDGWHVGELDLATSTKGFNIYTRPVDYGDDRYGLELIVAKPDGTKVTHVGFTPDQVTGASWLAELNRSIAALENGTPVDTEPDAEH